MLVSKTGWVRPWLIGGGLVNLVGNGLCILINGSTPRGVEFFFLIVAGVGMGFVYQTNTIAAQSQVARGELAAVTTMTMWSKSLGGIVGISMQGSIIQNVLTNKVLANPVSAPYLYAVSSVNLLHQTPPQVQYIVRQAYGLAFSRMMIATTALVAVGFGASLFTARVPLDKRVKAKAKEVDAVSIAQPQDVELQTPASVNTRSIGDSDSKHDYEKEATTGVQENAPKEMDGDAV